MNNYDDVYRMHVHHNLPVGTQPKLLRNSSQLHREGMLREELYEFQTAHSEGDLVGAADALIDLAVVVMGTGVQMGIPWQPLWLDVLRANLAKQSMGDGETLLKPDGWHPPNTSAILDQYSRTPVPAPVYSERPQTITLCGSTRFKKEYEYWNKLLTMRGHIVLSVGFFGHQETGDISVTMKERLDQLHLHKIERSDSIFVLDVDGYIGSSTQKEIEFAYSRGISISYLSKQEPDVSVP